MPTETKERKVPIESRHAHFLCSALLCFRSLFLSFLLSPGHGLAPAAASYKNMPTTKIKSKKITQQTYVLARFLFLPPPLSSSSWPPSSRSLFHTPLLPVSKAATPIRPRPPALLPTVTPHPCLYCTRYLLPASWLQSHTLLLVCCRTYVKNKILLLLSFLPIHRHRHTR